MKKLLCATLILFLLVGCSQTSEDSNVKKVGILQLLTHDALDQSRIGFLDALKDHGFVEGENLEVNYQNPEGDQSNLSTMADTLIAGNNDVILAIATTPAQQLQNVNVDTPILATAVTDFVGAGLAKTNEEPGGMIAGVSDGCPMEEQLNLLLEFDPNIKSLGIIYTSSEPNSEIQANQMADECQKRGLEVVVETVADKTTIDDTMQSFVGKIDALYVPTDNNIASAMASVDIVASDNNIPVLCGESNATANGGLLSLGVDYYKIGYQTGEMAAAILKGEKEITDFGVNFQEDIGVYYNSTTASKLGREIPQSILERGSDVAK